MKLKILQDIVKKKNSKSEFGIVTNLKNGESEIYEPGKNLSKEIEVYKNQIEKFFKSKKSGVIDGTEIFVESYIRPIKVIIVGAVHIAQYLISFAKSLNFEISIIDPRGYFATSLSQTFILPSVGDKKPVIILMVVVLPAPLGPRKPRTSPRLREKLILSTAINGPKLFVNLSTSIKTDI